MTIPPYQPIDLMLGKKRPDIPPPTEGFVVSCPTNGTTLFTAESDAVAALDQIRARSRYPDSVSIRPAWIHHADVCYGQIVHRKYWTPR